MRRLYVNAILYQGLEHRWALVSAGGPGGSPLGYPGMSIFVNCLTDNQVLPHSVGEKLMEFRVE